MRRQLPVPPPGWPDPEGDMINDPNRPRTIAESWELLGDAIAECIVAMLSELQRAVDDLRARVTGK